MISTGFDEANGTQGPPEGFKEGGPFGDPQGISTIFVYQGHDQGGTPVVISCWKLTPAELNEINRAGRVWLVVMGQRMQPVWLSTFTPFVPPSPPCPRTGSGLHGPG